MILAVSCTLLAILLALGAGSESTQLSSKGLAEEERISAFGDDPNTTAGVLSLGILALVGLTYDRKKANLRGRLLAWVGIGVLAGVIVLTGSRGGLVAVMIGLLALFLSGRSRVPWLNAQLSGVRLKVGLIIVIAISLLIGISYYYEPARKRWERVFTEGSMSGRERIFPAALEMFLEKPLIGWGPTHHIYELGSRTGRPFRDTHNLYLWILTETGLVGGIPFFVGLWYCLRGAWKARSGVHGALPLALLLSLLIMNLSLTWHNMKLFWIVLAYTLVSGDVSAIHIPKPRKTASLLRR
jgi:O-antigen ligase